MTVSNTNPAWSIGFFYSLKDQKDMVRGYLWGTADFLKPFDFQVIFYNKIEKGFNKSEKLIVEFDALGKMRQETTSMKAIQRRAEEFENWGLKLQIQAEVVGKTVETLETIETHTKAEELYSYEYETNIVLQPVTTYFNNSFGEKKLKNQDASIRTSFQEGSEEKMEEVANFGLSDEARLQFYDDRNEKMAERINALLTGGNERFFIAISACHLVGKKGVVALLSEMFWKVTKVH